MDRKMIKWEPFNSVISSSKMIKDVLKEKEKIKKPICTEMALHRAMNTIEKLSKGDNDLAVKILNQSVDHCWQGLFELKDNEPHSANKGTIDWNNV